MGVAPVGVGQAVTTCYDPACGWYVAALLWCCVCVVAGVALPYMADTAFFFCARAGVVRALGTALWALQLQGWGGQWPRAMTLPVDGTWRVSECVCVWRGWHG